MRRTSWHAVLMITVVMMMFGLSQTKGFAIDIDILINNSSFEEPPLDPNQFTSPTCPNPADTACIETATPVEGWQVVGVAGTWEPTAASYPGLAPDGSNVAYANSSSEAMISQVLAATLEDHTSYILEVDIGNRADKGFVGYKVQLWAGGVLLAEDDDELSPAPGTFARSTVAAHIGTHHPALGENLEIVLVSKGSQTNFDDVILTARPFPPTVKVPFYVKLSGGEHVLVAKNRSLELRARCLFEGPVTAVELFFTSTQDGWVSDNGPLLAGQESLVAAKASDEPAYSNDDGGRTAAAPDGSFIGVANEATGVGVNVFEQDCVAIGAALLIKESH